MSAPSSERDPVEQLAEEFAARCRRGERPSLTEYTDKYPDLAGRIRECFPAGGGAEPSAVAPSPPTEAVDPRAETADRVPARLGEYRIVREVGRGGMGIVYEAVQESLGRHVALKVLPFHGLVPPIYRERFAREARAAARLHHSNIVPVFGTGAHEGIDYYAMQFIHGQGLNDVLREVRRLRRPAATAGSPGQTTPDGTAGLAQGLLTGQFSRGDALALDAAGPGAAAPVDASAPTETGPRVAGTRAALPPTLGQPSELAGRPEAQYFRGVAHLGVQVADALAYAHRQGLLHRDIKPSNLLLDTHGIAWVTDFGLAKSEGDELTSPGDIVGTVRYMAPERFRGQADPRSDVYSLGVTLYELMTLRPAFEDANRARLIERVAREEPPTPRKLDAHIPRDLETIVLKAMAKEPAGRYGSADALAEDLRRFLADRPVLARRSPLPERAWRWCRRNPAVATLSGFAALLVAAVAVVSSVAALWLHTERDTALDNLRWAERAEKQLQKEHDLVLVHVGEVEHAKQEATDKLWGSYLAQARASRWSGQAGRRFTSLAALGRAAAIRPSLDVRNEAIACMALADLRRMIRPLPPSVPSGLALAFDSTLEHYACAGAKGAVTVRRAADHRVIASLPNQGEIAHLDFSPDGELLAIRATGPLGIRVTAWDWRHGAVLRQTAWGQLSWGVAFSSDGRRLAVGKLDGSIELLGLRGQAVQTLEPGTTPSHLCFHPDGRRLAASHQTQPVVQVRDVETGRVVLALRHPAGVRGLAWDDEGRRLATACADHNVYVWDILAHPPRATVLKGHDAEVVRVAFSHRGDLLASTSWDDTARLWDPATGEQLVSSGPMSAPDEWPLHFTPDDRRLAFVRQRDGNATFWDVAGGRECGTLYGHLAAGKGPWHVDFSPTGRLMASGSGDGVRLWDMVAGREVAFLPVGRLGLLDRWDSTAAVFDGTGGLVTSGPRGLHRWPLARGPKGDLRLGPAQALAAASGRGPVALARDGRTLAAVDLASRRAVVVDLQTGRRVAAWDRPNDVVSLAVSPDGRRVALGTYRGSPVTVWDAATGVLAARLPVASAYVSFSPDGQWLATGGEVCQLWDTDSWTPARVIRIEPAPDAAGALAFSPDGKVLAIAYASRVIRLVETATGHELARLPAPRPQLVTALRFSRDGCRLAVACETHAVQVWNLHAIRARLATMGLDWQLPALSPARPQPAAGALTVKVLDGGLLLPPQLAAPGTREQAQAALALWSLSMAFAPYHPDPYHQLGHAYEALGQPERAADDFSAALRLQPPNPKAEVHLRVARARNYLALRRFDQAVADLRRAVQLDPGQAEACNNLAWLYVTGPQKLRDPAKALPLARQAVAVAPGTWSYRNTLGVVHYRLGHYEPAVVSLERSLRESNGAAAGYDLYFLAMCHARLGDPRQARDCFSRASQWVQNQKAQLSATATDELKAVGAEAHAVLAEGGR
jgi:serine/threonine protein kinase/WD40 repeat protein/tetratricopeptide (TPR) repeat protein